MESWVKKTFTINQSHADPVARLRPRAQPLRRPAGRRFFGDGGSERRGRRIASAGRVFTSAAALCGTLFLLFKNKLRA
ncbi:unnamed protein product [Lota lota]